MYRDVSFFNLLRKKLFDTIHLKIFTIINTALVISLGIVIISMGLNFNRYKNYKIKSNDYFRQITIMNNDKKDYIDNIIADITSEEYIDCRFIYNTAITATQIENIDIEMLNFHLSYVDKTNDTFFLPSEVNSGFKIIGSNTLKDNELIVSFNYAKLISEFINKDYTDILGKNIIFNENGIIQELTIVGIIDEQTSLLMNYLGNSGLFAYNNDIFNYNISYATFEFIDLTQLESIINKFNNKDVALYHYIDNIKNIINQNGVFTFIFIIMGIITLLVSNGIVMSSVNMEFINQLPFISVLKIIGVKNSIISMFTYIQSIIIVFCGFIISIPISFLMNFIISSLVNSKELFGNLDFEIISLNLYAFIFCLVIIAILNVLSFFLQVNKIRILNINNIFLYELEE